MVTHDESTRTRSGALSRRRALRGIGAAAVTVTGLTAARTGVAGQEATPEPAPVPVPVPEDFKVVLHAALEEHWIYVLSNLKNLTKEWPRARLRVVADGTAVYTLQGESDQMTDLDAMAAAGVEVYVCPNALAEHKIPVANMPAYAHTELGGVVALVQAHNEGFIYVKP